MGGTPKSSILVGLSITNHPAIGDSLLMTPYGGFTMVFQSIQYLNVQDIQICQINI